MRNCLTHFIALFGTGFLLSAEEVKLANPSFESGTASYWISRPAMVKMDAAEFSDGKKSLAVTPETGKTVAVVFNTGYSRNSIYEISFDAKTDTPENGPQLTISLMLQGTKPIRFFTANKQQAKELSTPAKLDPQWKTLKYTIGPIPEKVMNQNVKRLMFYFNIKGGPQNGKVWIDNIKLNLSPAVTAPQKQEPLAFVFPKAVRVFETNPDITVLSNAGSGTIRVAATDAFGKKIFEQESNEDTDKFQFRLPGNDYYRLSAELIRDGEVKAKTTTSLFITTPLPEDYYSTPDPAFGVWGLNPAQELQRLGGAKWDRQLFFTVFQKKDAKPTPPSKEQIANRSPVKIIRCMNILNPFKRMVPVPEQDREKLAKQLETEISSRRGLVDVWETQNEPMVGENFHGTMNDVMDIIKLESAVVRKCDPGRTIAGICINPMNANQFAQYIGYYRKHGIDKYIDAVMLHPYIPGAQNPDASGYVETLNRLQKELHAIAGRPVPMYISEIGYSTKPGGEVTELQQAAYLARVVILNRTIKELKACVWHIGIWNDATSQRELDFGMLRKFPKKSPVREPKPAFGAWATVSRMTYNAKPVKELNIGRKVRVWLFDRNGTPLLIAYSLLPEPVDFRIVMNTPEVTITEVCGKTRKQTLKDGVLSLRLTEAPVYISGGKLADFSSARFNAKFSPEELSVAPSRTSSVEITLPSEMASAGNRLKIQSSLPLKQKVTGGGIRWKAALSVPAGTLPGEYDLFFRLEDKGNSKYIWQKSLTVKAPMELEQVRPVLSADKPAIQFAVRRNTAGGNGTTVEILENEQKILAKTKLGNESSKTLSLANPSTGRKNSYSARFTAPDGFKWTQTLPADIAPVKIPFLRNALELPQEKWPASGRYQLAGGMFSLHGMKGTFDRPAGTVALAYDKEYLYFSLEVKDKDFMPQASAASLWNGDSLQIGVSVPQSRMIRPNNDGIQETAYAEFGVKADGKTPDSWVWASMNLNLMPLHQPVPGILMKNSYGAETIHYRFAVPWKTLNIKPSAGMPLGISILVNDRDPAGRHWLEWFSGIANGKDPASYGRAVLQ